MTTDEEQFIGTLANALDPDSGVHFTGRYVARLQDGNKQRQ
jgi:hypothetical protein